MKISPTYGVIVISLSSLLIQATAQEEEDKNPDDPTKIITKLGLGYTEEFTLSGSLSLDPVRKINARINEDGSEWRLGGSWLFDFGIVNVNFSRTDYEGDAYKNNYSIGTFLPLSVLGVDTGKWQVFPMAGFSHNDGQSYFPTQEPTLTDDYVLLPSTSDGGYVGAFALRPISDKWTLQSFVGGSMGSDSYSGYWFGAGVSYRLDDRQSLSLFGFVSEDDFGRVEKVSVSYSIEFGK